MDRRARAIAASLYAAGIKDGDRVLLLYPPGLDFTAAFFGCLYAGVVAIPVYPPHPARLNRTLPRLQAIIADAQAAAALTTTPLLALASKLFETAADLKALRWLATDVLPENIEQEWQRLDLSSDTLAFLQYTSGSTGAPRGVMLKHSQILHNASLVHYAFRHMPDDTYFSWLPTFHDMGLMVGVLHPLYAGIPAVLISPAAFLQRPILWLQGISRYRSTTSGGPNFAYDLCVRKITAEQRATLDLSTWRIAFNGAEPVRAKTLAAFAKTFASCGFRQEALYPCYGLAEATLVVSGGNPDNLPVVQTFDADALGDKRAIGIDADEQGARSLVSSGRELKDERIVIVDTETMTECAPGQLGEIWVASPSIAAGYWGRPAETEQTFGAYLLNTGQGPFLRTGDLAFMRDGELFIVGRLKDLIIIRGLNHYPQDIELTVETAHPALRPGCGAAFSVEVDGEERLVVVQEVDTGREVDFDAVVEAIREAVANEHELSLYAVSLIERGTIPKTTSGKIQRRASRERFLRATLETVAEWRAVHSGTDNNETVAAPVLDVQSIQSVLLSQTEIIGNWLVSQLAARLGMNPAEIDPNKPIVRYGLDSLMAVELVHALDTGLGARVSMSSFLEGASIAEIAADSIKQLTAATAVPRLSVAEPETAAEYPLSQGQRGLWFLHQFAPGSAAYNIVRTLRVTSELDSAALRRALQALVDRHPCLRTTFKSADGEPLQRIQEHAEAILIEEDVANWTDELLNDRLDVEAQRPFDLGQCPLLRVSLFRKSHREHVMLLAVHHIVADLWSLTVLLQELGALYEAERTGTQAQLPPVKLQYADYVRWQRNLLASDEGERLRAYWHDQLSGDLPVLELPTDRPRPRIESFRGSSYPFHLGAELTAKLKTFSKDLGVTLYMTLLAGFQSLLHRYTNQDDILVGCPVVGRSKAEWGQLVGYFVNPLVLRVKLSGTTTFTSLLEQVRDVVLHGFDHQEYPFSLLVEQLQPRRDSSRSPLFQTMFVLQRAHLHGDEGLSLFALGAVGARVNLGGLELESMPLDLRVSQFDLTVMMAEAGEELAARIEFNTDLFDRETIERMAEHFRQLLESAVAEPQRQVGGIEMLSNEERQQVVHAWNDSRREYERACIHELFEKQAAQTPNAVAVVFNEETVSYGELNRRANQLAHYLRGAGVGPEVLVGILMEHSIEMVVGLLAVLKAGGAYVPFDPQYPSERLAFMIEDAEMTVLLTMESLRERIGEAVVTIVVDAPRWTRESTENPAPATPAGADNLAYVIYTSGSTGQPKGVGITHRSLVNYISWAKDVYLQNENLATALYSSLAFDLTVTSIYMPLISGNKIVIHNWDGKEAP
ncbi:MAG TPA: AMP-binding protein, partial [Pyrinomonadaceae bacterium]|nr:AMP-binding protein [Pyrinomonadaceae bacterium]